MNWRIESAQLASERAKLSHGRKNLATVSATAPFLGMLLTVWGMVNLFPALGIPAGSLVIATFALFSRQMLAVRPLPCPAKSI